MEWRILPDDPGFGFGEVVAAEVSPEGDFITETGVGLVVAPGEIKQYTVFIQKHSKHLLKESLK